MGLIFTEIALRNPLMPGLPPIITQARLDATTMVMRIPASLARQLKLEEAEKREMITTDGRKEYLSYVGPIQITFENRGSFCGALVTGDTVLLGNIAMEDIDLVISPMEQRIEVNSDSPDFAQAIVM